MRYRYSATEGAMADLLNDYVNQIISGAEQRISRPEPDQGYTTQEEKLIASVLADRAADEWAAGTNRAADWISDNYDGVDFARFVAMTDLTREQYLTGMFKLYVAYREDTATDDEIAEILEGQE